MHRGWRPAIAVAVCLLPLGSAAAPPAAAPAAELYHIHVVQAAAGQLPALMETYLKGPGARPGDPQVDPLILRHSEGGDWDLIVITPVGADYVATAAPPPPPVQQFNDTVAGLAAWHEDTLAVGPAWTAVQQALLPTRSAAPAVYVVSDYRALPGRRAALSQALERIAQPNASRAVVFAHVDGASWNFLTVTRHLSWAALGEQMQPMPPPPVDLGLELRQHLAAHHDTVATYVGGGEARP